MGVKCQLLGLDFWITMLVFGYLQMLCCCFLGMLWLQCLMVPLCQSLNHFQLPVCLPAHLALDGSWLTQNALSVFLSCFFSDFLRLPLFFTDMLVFLLFPLNYLQSDINFINNLRMSWIYFKIQVDPGFLQVIDFKIQVDPCVYTGHWFTSTLIWKAAFTFSVFIGEIKKERIVHGLSY